MQPETDTYGNTKKKYDDGEDQWKNNDNEEMKGGDFGDVALAHGDLDKIPTIFVDDSLEFVVTNPSMIGSHIEYQVKGVDRQGPWEG